MGRQLDIFHVQKAYEQAEGPLSNDQLYDAVADIAGMSIHELNAKSPIGQAGSARSKAKRQIRWYQQTLKSLKVLKRVERGVWALSEDNGNGLDVTRCGVKLVGYSTTLGVAIWSNNHDVLKSLDEPIHLCVTSPPYPLRVQRRYGNVDEHQWVDFITQSLEPIVNNLVAGGSIVLNVSNDIFQSRRPSRSLYLERMVLALHDRLGLYLMDRWPWINLSKPPGPTYWACVNRVQLCSGWEPVYWFTNDPDRVRSDNRQVLEPHTDQHRRVMQNGGEGRVTDYADGAYRLRTNSFSRETTGRIPKNVIQRGHSCADTLRARAIAQQLQLPAHSATFPTSLPDFAIRFLTQKDDLVIDLFSGLNKTGLAAQRAGRRWIACEKVLQYIRIQAELFSEFDGYWCNPSLSEAL